MNGQTLIQAFIPLPQGEVAVYNSSGLAYYRHTDHLGSSRFATTPSQTLYSSTAYAPFGEPYAQSGATDLSFTGVDQDTVSGIHDFIFRRYPTVQGRWLSPDPAGLSAVDPSTPQTWNRYAYVANNPLSNVDPLGLKCQEDGSCALGSNGTGGTGGPPCFMCGGWGGPNAGDYGGAASVGTSSGCIIDFWWVDVSCAGGGSLGSRGSASKAAASTGAANTGAPQNPCAGDSAANLDYSANKQHIIDDHLAWFQGQHAPSMTSSQYMFEGSIKTVDQAWIQIMAFNAYSFTNPNTVSQVGNAYRFTASYPIHPPAANTGFERRKFQIIFGIPFYSSWRTTDNTVVVQTNCKTVVTSYPGKP